MAPPPVPKTKIESAEIAALRFKGDHLRSCVHAIVRIVREGEIGDAAPDQPLSLSAEHLASLLLEHWMTMEEGGEHSPDDTITPLLAALALGRWQDLPPRKQRDSKKAKSPEPKTEEENVAAWNEKVRTVMAMEWPFGREAEVRKGDLVKADSCELPDGRKPLGWCVLMEVPTALRPVGWAMLRFHFDVASTTDSDSGMKGCLAIGGQWSVIDRDDPHAVRQQARQRRAQLREQMGRLLGEP